MNITSYLENSAKKYPEKIAVISDKGKYTYSKLLSDSRKIGTALISKGFIKQSVALFMPKSYETLCCFMGIVYARSFYTILNPELPMYRLELVLETLEAKCIITNKENYELAKEHFKNQEILLVEDIINTEIDIDKIVKVQNTALDIDPLYANFTSGSTGNPKGVLISNRSVIDFINVFVETFEFDNNDIVANQAPWDFDVSTKDIYTALSTGATLLIVPRELFSKPIELMDYLNEHKATVMIWAVSALCLITTFHAFDYKGLDSVKKVLFSGEVMPLKHLKQWLNALPQAVFVNLYGPTEITCNCTYHVIDRDRDYESGLPIGKSFRNEEVFLLDDNDKLVEDIDVAGEVCVRGTALGLGYFNAKEQTEKVFVQNPLNNKYIDMIYRTRDLAKYNEKGELVFAGRKDFQIKFQGHRIELEEIEKHINDIDGVNRCCCIFNEAKQRLLAYYISDLDKNVIVEKLKEKLPTYMVPSRLIKVDSFPLNKNGKIDRKALLEIKK